MSATDERAPSGRPPTPTKLLRGTSRVWSHRQDPFFIGVAGGTASGKSTVCDAIMQRLAEQSVTLVELDAFYRDLSPAERANVKGEGAAGGNTSPAGKQPTRRQRSRVERPLHSTSCFVSSLSAHFPSAPALSTPTPRPPPLVQITTSTAPRRLTAPHWWSASRS